jgi:hypothetical protein
MLKEIFAISSYPTLDNNGAVLDKLLIVLKVYGILVLGIIFAAPVLVLADRMVTVVFHHKSLSDQNRQSFHAMFHRLGFLKAYIFVCLLGPAFEETIFRLWLSFKKQHLAISVIIALFYFGAAFFHFKNTMLKLGIEVAIAIVVIAASLIFIPKTEVLISPENKRKLIILSICLFGLMHIFNFIPFDHTFLWLYPVYVIPQLLMGWGMTYVRFKNGFVWGIVLHSLINTVSLLIGYH